MCFPAHFGSPLRLLRFHRPGLLATLNREELPGMEEYLRQMKENLDMVSSLTPTDIVLKMLGSNIYYCTLLSIPTALVAMRRKKETPYNPQ